MRISATILVLPLPNPTEAAAAAKPAPRVGGVDCAWRRAACDFLAIGYTWGIGRCID